MNKEIQVKVDTFGHDGREDAGLADAVIFECNGNLSLDLQNQATLFDEYVMMKMVALYLAGMTWNFLFMQSTTQMVVKTGQPNQSLMSLMVFQLSKKKKRKNLLNLPSLLSKKRK